MTSLIPVQRTDLRKMEIKFSFKNECEQTFSMEVTEEEAEQFKELCKQAVGSENSWFSIPDIRKKGRFIMVNMSELLHISTTI